MKFLISFFILFISYTAVAGEIVATVNDVPISSYDTLSRAKLMALQKSQKLTDSKKNEYMKDALKALVDEQIKISEAQRNGFTVSDDEVKQAIAHLEAQNQLKSGQMAEELSKNDIPLATLKNQIKADLLWLQVMQKNKSALSSPLKIEIDKRKNTLREKLKEEGFYVAEIVVPNAQEAEKCYKELHSGVSFDVLAKKYSKGETAADGGEIGWIKNDHYSKEIIAVLRQMGMSDVSAPLKTQNGYLLVMLIDHKKSILTDTVPVWELAQMALPTNKTAAFGKKITSLKSCPDFMTFAQKEALPESVKSGMLSPDQLPAELKNMLVKEKVNRVIGPVSTPEFDLFFMKCTVTNKQVLPDDSQIKDILEAEKMEVLSNKLLANARRYAVVEYKK